MADREVNIKLGIKAAPGDPFQQMAKNAKNADVAVKGVEKSWQAVAKETVKAAGSLDNFSKTLAKIKSNDAFAKLSGDIMKSSRSLDEFNARMARTEQRLRQNAAGMANYKNAIAGGGAGATGGGWRETLGQVGTSAAGRLGVGGGSATAGAVGALGLGVFEASSLWKRSNAMKEAGIKDDVVTKDQASFYARGIGGFKDWWTGRGNRDMIEDRRIDEMQHRVSRDFALRGQRDMFSDMARNATAPGFASEFDPIKNLRLQKGGLEKEYVTIGDRLQGNQREEAQMRIDLRGGKFGFNGVGEEEAHRKILELGKLIERDQKSILDIQQRRVGVQDQLTAGVKREALTVKEQFSVLDPAQREDAIRLGSKLREGGRLSGEEEQIAASLGVLNPQLRDARMKQLDQGPDLARFFAAAGTDVQQRVGQRALADAKFDRLELKVELDEQKLADILRNDLGDVIKDIKVMAEQQAQNMQRMEDFQKRFAMKRNNVKEQRD